MAATLKTKAVERSLKTNSAAYYSYLDDSKNPVLQSFEAQISDFKNFVAKQQKSNQAIDGRLYVLISFSHSLINSIFLDLKHYFNYGVRTNHELLYECIAKN